MKIKFPAQYISLLIVTGLIVYTVINTLASSGIDPILGSYVEYVVPENIIYGGICLIFIWAMALIKDNYWKYFFSVVLIAATVGLIQFRTYSVGLDFGLFQIEITILFLLVVHLITNREIIKVIIKKLGMGDVEQTESTLIDDDVINTYLAKYSTKTTKELEDIINSGDYSREATEAARKLMTK